MEVDQIDMTDAVVATEVLALQKAAYGIEAELVGSDAIPPLHETLPELLSAELQWLGIRHTGELVAVLGFSDDGEDLDIDRLVVAPSRMRRGFGSALVESLRRDAAITVSTGTLNHPARQFYLKHGFVAVGKSEPAPGLSVTHFERRPR